MNNARVFYTVIAIQAAVLGYALLPSQSVVAQIPDQGAQLQQIVEENKAINAKMDRIIQVLESGKMKIQVEAAPQK